MERREHKRFEVRSGAFAVLSTPESRFTKRVGQIIDISMGGLAFCYIATEEPSNGESELKIITTNNGFHLDRLPSRTVSDFETPDESPFTSISMRRSGLQFGRLTEEQISMLEHFILQHTVGEV